MKIIGFLEDMLRAKWSGVKRKKGRKMISITTMDLDDKGKLRQDHLSRRRKRKKKKSEPKSLDSID